MPERAVVGIVRRTRGVRGELVVESQSDIPGRFNELSRLYLVTSGGAREVTLTRARYIRGSEVWVTLAEITDREEAKLLRGATLEIDLSDRPPPPEGCYYYDQLEGLEVFDTAGRRCGRLTRVFPRGGQDLYGVEGPCGEVLVPAADAIVKKVDLDAGRMIIDPPPGLLEPDDAH